MKYIFLLIVVFIFSFPSYAKREKKLRLKHMKAHREKMQDQRDKMQSQRNKMNANLTEKKLPPKKQDKEELKNKDSINKK